MAGSSEPNPEVFSWLKSLPVAPEYHPTLAEFQDPISYIFKIEKEASKYGICKIVPPVLQGPKKTAIANLNKSLAARAAGSGSAGPKSPPTFTTRQQQIGFCPRKPRPVQKPVWQSGEYYTFQQFEAKAKNFERNYLKKCSKKGGLSALEIETLYWKASVDKPFSVEYANDMPGSAFVPLSSRKGRREASEGVTVGETEWNMRSVSRAKGSLLRFMKEEIPGVTSPMVYVAMLFSWFAWHVEDHDLHSLNYMHMGAGKTWYGVPRDAAVAFEEVIRIHGYGGEVNPLVTFATLGEKTTVMSPEVFISAGIPCCRLVQNTGEFVVTFPRAYHSGFSHGFNFGEAANIATPEWLTVAKDAAIRRASINYPPMVSHFQLLYDLALALCSRIPMTISAEPRSSRLKDKKKGEGEAMVKEQFVQNVIQNNDLLHVLGKGSRIVLLPHSSSDISVCSSLRVGQLRANPRLALGLCSPEEAVKASKGLVSNDTLPERNQGMKQVKGFYPVKGKFAPLYERNLPSLTGKDDLCPVTSELPTSETERESTGQCDGLSDQRLFSCVTCGILTFTCVAIIQPREAAAKYLMSADCSFFNDWIVGSGVTSDRLTPAGGYANDPEQKSCAGRKVKNASDGLYDVPVQSADYQIQTPDQSNEVVSDTASQRDTSALGLLASTYGNSSDSEEDQGEPDVPVCADETISRHCSPDDKLEFAKSKKSFAMRNYPTGVAGGDNLSISRFENGEEVSVQVTDLGVEHGCLSKNLSDGSHLKFDRSVEYGNDNHASARSSGFEAELRSSVKVPCITSCCSPVSNDVKNTKLSQITITGEDTNTMFAPRSDDDSSRIHVFCLEHAKEVEQQLRPIGGVNMLLLCHPDYPKIEAEAKLVAEELRINHPWNDVMFKDATKEDEERIQSALDGEEAIPGNGDWTVKLGINLYYSANLSRSPLYSKQMPFNSVIYNAFGRSSPASSPTKPNVYRRRSVKQKKVVVGKWCGKVWMSNQVHPFLVQKDPDEQEHDTIFQIRPMPDVKPERNLESVSKPESTTIIKQYGRKRKMTVESGSIKKVKSCTKQEVAGPDDLKGKTRQQRRKLPRSKQAKHIESEAAVSNDLLECNSEQQQRNQRSRQSKCIERKGADSDDGHQQRRPFTRGKRAKRTKIEDAVSDGLLEDDTHQHHSTLIRGKQAKHFQKEDDISDDSLEDDSHQQHETDLRGDQDRCMDEDVVSDDSLEHRSHWQLWRAPRDKQAQNVEREENSDDSMEHNSLQQYRRALLGKQAKCFEKEEYAMSDDSLERHSSGSKQFKRVDSFSDDSLDDDSLLRYSTHSGKQAKSAEREDAVSDDSLEFKSLQQHKMSLRGKQTKCVEQDVSDDSQKHNLLQQRRTLRGKQAKCVDREDAVSDDSMEHNSLQQHRRTLRGKQARCFEKEDAVSNDSQDESCLGKRSLRVKQKKQENSQQTGQDSARLRKTPRIMKPQTPRQMKKETPRPRNVKFEQDDELDLFVEGGPSTRLRKRIPKPVKEAGTKEKEKQQKGRKKVKNAPAGKAAMPYKLAAGDEEDEYQCDIEGCTMSFGSKQELVLHKRNVCPVKGCGKKFFSHKYLVQHRRVHTDDRPLKCPWKGCKMSFKWAWARTEHIRVHTGARPYVCAEAGCGQTFRFVSDFSRHKRKTGHSVKKGKGGRR